LSNPLPSFADWGPVFVCPVRITPSRRRRKPRAHEPARPRGLKVLCSPGPGTAGRTWTLEMTVRTPLVIRRVSSDRRIIGLPDSPSRKARPAVGRKKGKGKRLPVPHHQLRFAALPAGRPYGVFAAKVDQNGGAPFADQGRPSKMRGSGQTSGAKPSQSPRGREEVSTGHRCPSPPLRKMPIRRFQPLIGPGLARERRPRQSKKKKGVKGTSRGRPGPAFPASPQNCPPSCPVPQNTALATHAGRRPLKIPALLRVHRRPSACEAKNAVGARLVPQVFSSTRMKDGEGTALAIAQYGRRGHHPNNEPVVHADA